MSASPTVRTCLWFDQEGEEAANLYCEVVPNSRIVGISRASESIPDNTEGAVLTVEFELAGQAFQILNGGPHFKPTPAASIVVEVDGQHEVDRIWDRLTADGGQESQCGWLVDKFGVSWQIVPTQFRDLMNDPDAAKVDRVVQAMLTMKRLDIAALQAAADAQPAGS